jgi:uncharacterized protein YxjI
LAIVQERAISFTGEDFDIFDVDGNQPYCRVRGAMLHLPGKDKMRIKSSDGAVCATLDRKAMTMTPTYDILRGDSGDKIGWIEKAHKAKTSIHIDPWEHMTVFGAFKASHLRISRGSCNKVDLVIQGTPVVCPLDARLAHIAFLQNLSILIVVIHRMTDCIIHVDL